MDMEGVEDMNDDSSTRECFTSIQSRKLGTPLAPETCRLCPSMDLTVLGLSSSAAATAAAKSSSTDASQPLHGDIALASSLWIHRTVSWQKLAHISASANENENDPSALESGSSDAKDGISYIAWSPDGRHLAVASRGVVETHSVESLSNDSSGGSGSASVEMDGGGGSQIHSLNVAGKIVGLSWFHLGRPHPIAWNRSMDELEEEISWRYQNRYVDRASAYLPPSEYQSSSNAMGVESTDGWVSTTTLPKCTKPLSIVCLSTTASLEVYVHGRYHLLSIPRPPLAVQDRSNKFPTVDVVCSQDLTRLVLHTRGSGRLSLMPLPFQYKNTSKIQCLASLSSQVVSHLQVLERSTVEIANSWRSSLKPLHDKLAPLTLLLSNYNVHDTIAAVLRQFITLGHTSQSSDVANAMDQFFTGVQMNDQLVQRMERTLQASVANVEGGARKKLLSPARALVYHTQELAGMFRADFEVFESSDDKEIALFDDQLSTMLLASQAVLLRTESILTELIQARFRLAEFVTWLRSTGAQIKARGTAPNSVQRENAMKRRAPQGIIDRLLQHLRQGAGCHKGQESLPLAEKLMNLNITCQLNHPKEATGTKSISHPSSPRSCTADFTLAALSTKPLSLCLRTANNTTNTVLDYPRNILSPKVIPHDLMLPHILHPQGNPEQPQVPIVALQTRIGRDTHLPQFVDQELQELADIDKAPSFFSPNEIYADQNKFGSYDCRQWSIVAQSGVDSSSIQLFAIPSGGFFDVDDDAAEDDHDSLQALPFTLTAKLSLPDEVRIQDIGFYSDDGKSTLSSGIDQGTGEEGKRQKLCILTKQDTEDGEASQEEVEQETPDEAILQLWLLDYNGIKWHAVPHETILPTLENVHETCCTQICPSSNDDDERQSFGDGTSPNIAFASTRMVGIVPNDLGGNAKREGTFLLLSGSRGIGGVVVNHRSQGWSSMELFDFEEDGGEDDMEEDGDDCE